MNSLSAPLNEDDPVRKLQSLLRDGLPGDVLNDVVALAEQVRYIQKGRLHDALLRMDASACRDALKQGGGDFAAYERCLTVASSKQSIPLLEGILDTAKDFSALVARMGCGSDRSVLHLVGESGSIEMMRTLAARGGPVNRWLLGGALVSAKTEAVAWVTAQYTPSSAELDDLLYQATTIRPEEDVLVRAKVVHALLDVAEANQLPFAAAHTFKRACALGDVSLLQRCVRQDATLEKLKPDSRCLLNAIQSGSVETCRYLIERKAERSRIRALERAILLDHPGIVQLMHEFGERLGSGDDTVAHALNCRIYRPVRTLLELGYGIDDLNVEPEKVKWLVTAHEAVKHGDDAALVKVLKRSAEARLPAFMDDLLKRIEISDTPDVFEALADNADIQAALLKRRVAVPDAMERVARATSGC